MYLMKADGVSHTRSGYPLTHRVLLDRGLRSGEGNFAWRKADSRPSIIRWHEVQNVECMNEKTADEPASQKSKESADCPLFGPREWLGLRCTLSAKNQAYQEQQGSKFGLQRQGRATNQFGEAVLSIFFGFESTSKYLRSFMFHLRRLSYPASQFPAVCAGVR